MAGDYSGSFGAQAAVDQTNRNKSSFNSHSNLNNKKINELKVVRDYRDPQSVKLFWKKQPRTTGYNIRYGIDKEKLYHSFRVLKSTRITIHCPDKIKAYWFQVDAYNENGVSPGKPVLCH